MKKQTITEDTWVEIIISRKKYWTSFNTVYDTGRAITLPLTTSKNAMACIRQFHSIIPVKIREIYNRSHSPFESYDSTFNGNLKDFNDLVELLPNALYIHPTDHYIMKSEDGEDDLYIMVDKHIIVNGEEELIPTKLIYKLCLDYLSDKINNAKYNNLNHHSYGSDDGGLSVGCRCYSKQEVIKFFTKFLGGKYQLIVK